MLLPPWLLAAATALPVSVDVHKLPVVHVDDSPWAIGAAIASAAVAVATSVLAAYTASLAKQTIEGVKAAREAIAAEERRHMDGFMPHLRLDVRDVSEKQTLEGGLPIESRTIRLYVRNIGAGFAQNIRVGENLSVSPKVLKPRPPTALGVGEEALLAVKAWDAPKPSDAAFALTYQDAFGRDFESRSDNAFDVGAAYTWRRVEALSPS